MDRADPSEVLEHLYGEFADSIRENDPESVRQIYRQLTRAGRPLAEILDQGIRAAAGGHSGFEELLLGPRNESQADSEEAQGAPHSEPAETAATIIPDAVERLNSLITPALVRSAAVHRSAPTDVSEASIAADRPENAAFPAALPKKISVREPVLRSCILWFGVGAITAGVILSLVLYARVSPYAVFENHRTVGTEVSISLRNPPEKSGEVMAANSLRSVAAQGEPQSVITATEAGTGVPDLIAAARLSKRQELDPTPGTTDPNSASSSAISTVATPALSAPQPIVSAAELIVLLTRGDSFFALGDIASARRFYELGAEAGDGQAALRLGESFDPSFLQQPRFWGARADLSLALFWYKRARELGVSEAQVLLKSIEGE